MIRSANALIIKRNFWGIGEFILTPLILAQSYILSIFDIFNTPRQKTSLIPWFRGLILGLPIKLNDRIQKQPENERDWDFDVSMSSPFL